MYRIELLFRDICPRRSATKYNARGICPYVNYSNIYLVTKAKILFIIPQYYLLTNSYRGIRI